MSMFTVVGEAEATLSANGEVDVKPVYAKPIVTVNVYNGETNCSNDGISAHLNRLDLYGPEVEMWDVNPAHLYRAVKLVYRDYLGGIVHVEPVESPEANAIGWMAGGSYVGTSDSRFGEAVKKLTGHRFYGALSLHDRQETQAQYDRLSR